MLHKTKHYMLRVRERDITDENIASALCGIKISHHGGSEEKYLDRKSRTYIVVSRGALVTAMKLRPKQMRTIIERSKRKAYVDFVALSDKEQIIERHKVKHYDKFSWKAHVFE